MPRVAISVSLDTEVLRWVDEARGDLEAATKANAKIQAKLLNDSSPVVASAVKDGKLSVVAAYYDLASGKVALLG